jgi:hypothetical protein
MSSNGGKAFEDTTDGHGWERVEADMRYFFPWKEDFYIMTTFIFIEEEQDCWYRAI